MIGRITTSFLPEHGYLVSGLGPEARARLMAQLERLDAAQGGRGLSGYCRRGQELLLKDAAATGGGDDAAAAGELREPELGERLRANTPAFEECEETGLREAPFLGFVIVAGGLGERLNGSTTTKPPQVKALLPAELLTRKSFLEVHCAWIEALQHRARVQTGDAEWTLPVAVMTSDDTHDQIVTHLTHHSGMLTEIIVMKQDKVACFADRAGRLAVDPTDPAKVVCKPHGHGDVHILMHKSGVAARWASRGVRHVVFLQDSNALAGRAILAAVGNSVRHHMDINMVAVARRAGEQIGAICHRALAGVTTNVEYNIVEKCHLPDQLKAKLPGNINVLVVRALPYAQVLQTTEGIVPEFVNPKYDASGEGFLSPVRLECMMQDLPLLFAGMGHTRVGFTELDRFLCFSAVKNNLRDALVRLNKTGFPESASSAESDLFASGRRLLAMAGCNIRTTGLGVRKIRGLPFEDGAKVVLGPAFGVTVAELRGRFPSPERVHISDRSTLYVDGNVEIHRLVLDGTLTITAVPGARIVIKNLRVTNQGSVLDPFEEEMDGEVEPVEAIRGYRFVEVEALRISATQPGEVVVDRG